MLAFALVVYDIVVWWNLHEYCEECRRTVSAIAILLALTQFFVMLGSLPVISMSMHLVMLLTVARNFIKSLMLYSIILVAFALCFFTLFSRDEHGQRRITDVDRAVFDRFTDMFRPEVIHVTSEPDATDADDINHKFTNFVSPSWAIFKTLMMLTGEVDTANIQFSYNFSYVVFIVFIILVTMVMSNLLTGLAVSDTQAIQSDAELTYWIYKARQLMIYEKTLGRDQIGW